MSEICPNCSHAVIPLITSRLLTDEYFRCDSCLILWSRPKAGGPITIVAPAAIPENLCTICDWCEPIWTRPKTDEPISIIAPSGKQPSHPCAR